MQLPIDVKALYEEAMDIDQARQTPLSVSVLIDESAPADVLAHVRSEFASAASHARVTVGYLGATFTPNPEDDIAVIIAGLDAKVGEYAEAIRAAGVPVMITTTLPEQVVRLAEESGFPIPVGDLISPDLSEDEKAQAAQAFEDFFGKIATPDAIEVSASEYAELQAPEQEEPTQLEKSVVNAATSRLAALRQRAKQVNLGRFLKRAPEPESEKPSMPELLSEDAKRAFNNRMGEWIIETCREKRLSFALAFPFVARPLSLEAVNATAVQNAGIGVVIILPGADMPVMTLNQAKMLLQIAAAYGQPMTADRLKELAGVVGGAFAFRSLARNVAGVVPGLGWAVKGAIGYTGTLAMGRAAIEYFENGAGIGGLTGTLMEVKDVALKFVSTALSAAQSQQPSPASEGEGVDSSQAAAMIKSLAGGTAAAAGPVARGLAKGAADSFRAGLKTMIGRKK